jgi:hypothetical protein
MAGHMKQPIKSKFFDRWLALWRAITGEVFAASEAAMFDLKAERIAERLKPALYYRPGERRFLGREGNGAR